MIPIDFWTWVASAIQRMLKGVARMLWLEGMQMKAMSHVDQAALVHNHQLTELRYHDTASRKRVGQDQIMLANMQKDNNKVTRLLRIFIECQVSAPFCAICFWYDFPWKTVFLHAGQPSRGAINIVEASKPLQATVHWRNQHN